MVKYYRRFPRPATPWRSSAISIMDRNSLRSVAKPNAGCQPFNVPCGDSRARFLSSFDPPCISSTIIANRRFRLSTLTPRDRTKKRVELAGLRADAAFAVEQFAMSDVT